MQVIKSELSAAEADMMWFAVAGKENVLMVPVLKTESELEMEESLMAVMDQAESLGIETVYCRSRIKDGNYHYSVYAI